MKRERDGVVGTKGKGRLFAGLVVLAGMMWAACDSDPRETHDRTDPAAADREHPVAEMVVREDVPGRVVRASDRATDVAELAAVAEALEGMQVRAEIGALEGTEEEILGSVTDALVSGDGDILILDGRASQVRVYDGAGDYRFSVGGAGRGPGEFVDPLSMALAPDGALLVGDATQQVHRFEPEDDGYTFDRAIPIGIDVSHHCVLGEELVVQGSGASRPELVHRYSMDGEHLGSFGRFYDAGGSLAEIHYAEALVACSSEEDRIYLASQALPYLRAYTAAGQPEWEVELADAVPVQVTETAQGSVRFGAAADAGGRYDLAIRLTPLPAGGVVMQIGSRTETEGAPRARYERLHTYLISADGEGAYPGDGWEEVLAVDSATVLTGRDDPFPRVRAAAPWGTW